MRLREEEEAAQAAAVRQREAQMQKELAEIEQQRGTAKLTQVGHEVVGNLRFQTRIRIYRKRVGSPMSARHKLVWMHMLHTRTRYVEHAQDKDPAMLVAMAPSADAPGGGLAALGLEIQDDDEDMNFDD